MVISEFSLAIAGIDFLALAIHSTLASKSDLINVRVIGLITEVLSLICTKTLTNLLAKVGLTDFNQMEHRHHRD